MSLTLMIDRLLDLFKNNPGVIRLLEERKNFVCNSLIEESVLIASAFKAEKRPILIIKNNLYNAQRVYERISSLLPDDTVLFAVEESLRVEAIASSPENMAAKVEALYNLILNDQKIIVTHLAAVIRQLPRVSLFKKNIINLKVNQEITMEELKDKLLKGGYSQVSHIDTPLTFALRGGIIDFYSMNNEYPVRVEFFDTVIDSIRYFDVNTQKTVSVVDEITCIPASDILFDDGDLKTIKDRAYQMLEKANNDVLTSKVEIDLSYLENHLKENYLYAYYALLDETGSLFDYLNNPTVLCEPLETVNAYLSKLSEETVAYIQEMVSENKLLPKFALMHDFHRVIPGNKLITFDYYGNNVSKIEELDLPKENLNNLIKLLLHEKYKVLMFLNDKEIERVIKVCGDMNLPYNLILDDEELTEGINITFNHVFQGFRCNREKLIVVSSFDLFEVKNKLGRFANKFKNAEIIRHHQELSKGDYVVHNTYGVGQYIGIETRIVQGIHRDFLKIVYRGNNELLVPLEQFRLVRKFVSREGFVPKLNKLGSDEWATTKRKIKENVAVLAERLVKLYSARENDIGYAYKEDSEDQKEFEDSFEYELTEDQKKAVIDVKRDMQSAKPMDRLIIGDVGFGKTEVAIRAAFKAVIENKQVAFLCPTTILSKQHFNTFKHRFKNYSVNIRVLNRFVLPGEIKDILKGLKEGKIDIILGTHRILSKDVKFKDLGLLIIDEEQRFGVEHKEKIKELKSSIDVISLSATPIPRTLQMSLVGIRQLSQLETPPDNRFPVQTYVVEKNDKLIKEVIERELARDGQVFYLFNNVDEIYNVARKVQKLVPDAKVMVAHGKMSREEIEDVMLRFTFNEINVLICTTIIETGIDIPNANTIIIDNADRFGLSQLYQIKGRVGRSNRIAYAYLMIPEKKEISEVASKRLKAIKEFAKLGSGYKVAMRDLTIRGAGDMLGPEQSGFIDTVGIDMYIEMLEEAIKERKGEVVEVKSEAEVLNIETDGYLPEDFTPDDYDKISMYQDIDKLDNLEDLEIFKQKVIDEYGRLPKVVNNLFDKKKLGILVNDECIDKYREVKGVSEIVFTKEYSDTLNGVRLFEIISKINKDIGLRYSEGKIMVRIPKSNDKLNMVFEVILRSKEAVNES